MEPYHASILLLPFTIDIYMSYKGVRRIKAIRAEGVPRVAKLEALLYRACHSLIIELFCVLLERILERLPMVFFFCSFLKSM